MHIFITGATGYIGGSVAERLQRAGHRITGLARSQEAAAKLSARDISPIIASLNDDEVLASAARAADAVINAADADNPWVVATLLDALAGSGKPFLHTSGSSIVGDRAGGEPSETVHDDTAPIRHRFEKAGRVAIDRAVVAAARNGVRSAVLCPCLIYGTGTGSNLHSIQVPMLADVAKKTGAGRHVGRGLNIWSNVHINDVAAAYELALERTPAGSFFFLESGEASFVDLARWIGESLGLGSRTCPMSLREALRFWSPEAVHFAFGSNSRIRAREARQILGWQPNGPGLESEVRRLLSAQRG